MVKAMGSRIERLCVERGLKMTGQRRVIAQVLSEAEDHPDVEELYRRAASLDARISVATVYRTVRLLEEKGILERRDFGGGRARYEATEHGHHYHLIDVDTGKVIEFEDAEHEQLMRQIANRLGFELVSHRMELFARRQPAEAEQPAARPAPPAARAALPHEQPPKEALVRENFPRDPLSRDPLGREPLARARPVRSRDGVQR